MIAGIGGASLGTELLKALTLAGRYTIFGCDISATAYGLYEEGFERSFIVDPDNYVASVIHACTETRTSWLIPGGERPTVLLGSETSRLTAAGIHLVANAPDVIRTYSDKALTFERLAAFGFAVPRTTAGIMNTDVADVGLPCIVKPATGSGGSAMVFFATSTAEVAAYADHIRRTGGTPIVQEYIPPDEGEFTIGVLSLPNGEVAGSVALRRALDSKLSVATRAGGGLISSGYSQGYIADFPSIRSQAEAIARAIGSRGALNIQGRVRGGTLLPFEINPRLSASTYLRAMAGFNEVDLLIQNLAVAAPVSPAVVTEGWYLRSLTERFVDPDRIRR